MRIRRWADLDDADRDALYGRGLDAIFDPQLRTSIGRLIDDVRTRGDAAVCDALARFDGVTIAPRRLRVTSRRDRGGDRHPGGRRGDRRRHRPHPGVQRAPTRPPHRLELRSRARPRRRREADPGGLGRLVRPVRQGELSERRLPAGDTGDGRRRPADRARRPADPGRQLRHRRSSGARGVPQARDHRGVPRQRSGRHRRAGFRHGVDPQGADGRRTGFSGGGDRPGGDAAPRA